MFDLNFTLSHLLQLIAWVGTAIGFFAALKHKTDNHSKEIEQFKKTNGELSEEVKDVKSTLNKEITLLNGEIIGLKKDISYAEKNVNEINGRLVNSVTQFQVEMVRSEARIVAHVDASFAAIKDIVKDVINSKP